MKTAPTRHDIRQNGVDYRRALAETAAYFERKAKSAKKDSALQFFCIDAAATCRDQPFPIPELDPCGLRRLAPPS